MARNDRPSRRSDEPAATVAALHLPRNDLAASLEFALRMDGALDESSVSTLAALHDDPTPLLALLDALRKATYRLDRWRVPLRDAIVWSIVADLFQRHRTETFPLRVFEGGYGWEQTEMYLRGVTIGLPAESDVDRREIVLKPAHDFWSLLSAPRQRGAPTFGRFLRSGLENVGEPTTSPGDAPARRIERAMGLPAGRRPRTPDACVLAMRLFAAVSGRYAFSPSLVDIRQLHVSAASKSSMNLLTHIPAFLREHFAEGPLPEDVGEETKSRQLWRIGRIGEFEAPGFVLVDARDGIAWSSGGRPERLDLWQTYQTNGYRLEPLVAWVLERLHV